jgi:solute carrier family 35 protein F1/2
MLKRSYNSYHIIAALVCVAGLALTILSDNWNSSSSNDSNEAASEATESEANEANEAANEANEEEEELYPQAVLGDIIVIAGSFLYALNNTIAELCVKSFDRKEYLGMLGVFGTIISIVQILIVEREAFANFLSTGRGGTMTMDAMDAADDLDLHSNSDGSSSDDSSCSPAFSLALIGAYVASISFFYIGVTIFLVHSEAALLNLSLLTSDIWAVLFLVFVLHESPSFLYFVAFVIICAGVVLYESVQSPLSL